MDIQSTIFTVADYVAMLDRGEVSVNREYQRSDQVWPPAARSFLIETILLGFPIPKLSLHQRTDVQTQRTIKDVVDGQQRTKVINDFVNDRFRLSGSVEVEDAAGKSYQQLPDELKQVVLSYGLNFDLFVSATDEEVRETFRRINSFTIPLNPEERRHATFQGPFKWFIHHITSDYDQILLTAGAFSQKQLVRMQDSKLLTEICSAFFDGITTTSKARLDRTYRDRDVEFPQEEELGSRVRSALDRLFSWTDLYETELMKPFQIYALALAVMHMQEPVETLVDDFDAGEASVVEDEIAVVNLTRLSDATDRDDASGPFGDFVRASSDRTNVRTQRVERFRWFCRALTSQLPE